jgi:protocatechuate 3,4-dioxygenase beta subunit
MIRHALFILSILSGVCVSLPAFSQTNSSNTATIRGSVIDSKTSQPVPGATVTIHAAQGPGKSNSSTATADGSFVLQGLQPGRYQLAATHNGYVESSRGRRYGDRTNGATVTVAAGQTVDSVVLRLTPSGVISGHITNERDEPMPGVLVQATRASYRNGRREFADSRNGFTDDRGEFRIWGLAPGRYYVKATNPRNGERGQSQAQVYVPTFFPGVYDPAQTQPLDLRPGDEVSGINLSLSPLHAVRVRGRVLTANNQPSKGAEVSLSQASGAGFELEAETDQAGKFDISGVPPGSYIVVAQQSDGPDGGHPVIGHISISVVDANVDTPDVVIFPGATVTGHLRAEGDRKLPLARTSASLRPLGAVDPSLEVSSVSVQPDGSFIFHDVPEGEYRVGLMPLPDGYFIHHEPAEPNIVVSHGHAPPIEVHLSTGAGRIQGTVYKDSDHQQVAASVTVGLVPDATRRANSEYYRVAMSDAAGQFVLTSIPPGDYSVFAMEGVDRDVFMDPDFLLQNEGSGKPVHVEEGGNLSLQLQLTSASDDSR